MNDYALFTAILTLCGLHWHRRVDPLGIVVYGSINEATTWTVLFDGKKTMQLIRRKP